MRSVTYAVVALVLLAFGAVQLASDAFCSAAAAPYAFPRRVPREAAASVYGLLDAAVPAEYVEVTLARDALARGDLAAAARHALRLPPVPMRSELLAQIALRRGQRALAFEYFFAAPDIAALAREVIDMAAIDPARAYAFERRVRDRLVSLRTHPDAVAEADWVMGNLAAASAERGGARRPWLKRSLRDDVAAARLSPLSEKYALAAAAAALRLGERATARRWYRRVRGIDPGIDLH